jgi:hypothetical protein
MKLSIEKTAYRMRAGIFYTLTETMTKTVAVCPWPNLRPSRKRSSTCRTSLCGTALDLELADGAVIATPHRYDCVFFAARGRHQTSK